MDEAEVIVVEDIRTPAEAWDDVRAALAAQGYRHGVTIGEITYFFPRWPDRFWRARVALDADGTMRVRGRTFTPLVPLDLPHAVHHDDTTALRPVDLPPMPSAAPFGVTGTFGSPRLARADEARVIGAVWEPLADYRDAIAGEALRARLDALGTDLARLWRQGIAPDGTARTTWATRRACIGRMWLDTADNDAGARVRERILRFVNEEVQATHPYEPAEVAAIEARRTVPDAFRPIESAR